MTVLVPVGESLKAFLKEYFDESSPHCGNCRRWKSRDGGLVLGIKMMCDKKGWTRGRGFSEWDYCKRWISRP